MLQSFPIPHNLYSIKQFQVDKQIGVLMTPSSVFPAKFISPTQPSILQNPPKPLAVLAGNNTFGGRSEPCMRTLLIHHLFGMYSGYVQDVHREQSYYSVAKVVNRDAVSSNAICQNILLASSVVKYLGPVTVCVNSSNVGIL